MTKVTLTTTGRRSGEPRPVTIYAFEDGERLVIVGSAGGQAQDPSWVDNLRLEPIATLKQGKTTRTIRAREVNGAERRRQWQLVVAGFPLYATYQRRTTREIPPFVLQGLDS